MTFHEPTAEQIKKIVKQTLKLDVKNVERFPTGLCHYVYDVQTDKKDLVVRIAHPDNFKYLKGASFWYEQLKPKGVPLPEVYYSDLEAKDHPYHFMIMERLKGTDLGNVYTRLSSKDKEAIVKQLIDVQETVGSLPQGSGFGEIYTYDDKFETKSWFEFLSNIEDKKETLNRLGIFDPAYVDTLEKELSPHQSYFDSIQSIPFLDDITTKNVIIDDNNHLSGIVDIDLMTYGDKIYNLGLTNMALLSHGYETDYIDMWCKKIKINENQYNALRLYTLSFCVDFMCEIGQSFNKKEADINQSYVKELKEIFTSLIER